MSKNEIVGIYLAAGKSMRMGKNKLLLPLHKMPMGELALRTALHSKLDRIFIITKIDDNLEWLEADLLVNERRLQHVACHNAQFGQSQSIRCGVQMAKSLNAKAVMILLADQPFITAHMINFLIDVFHSDNAYDYVASSYEGIMRPPIIFSASFFDRLTGINGDEGARQILRHSNDKVGKIIPFDESIYFLDIDTSEDYQNARNLKRDS